MPLIEPLTFEGSAVAAFVPATIHRRAVQNSVHQPKRQTPPTAPEVNAASSRDQHYSQEHGAIAQRWLIGAPHQRFHGSTIGCAVVPPRRQPAGNGLLSVGTSHRVIAHEFRFVLGIGKNPLLVPAMSPMTAKYAAESIDGIAGDGITKGLSQQAIMQVVAV